MATREETLRNLRFRDDFTTRDAGTILDYVDQEIAIAIVLPGSVTVADEGTPIAGAPHTTLDFVGANIVAADAGSGVATITVVAGGVIVEEEGSPIAGGPHTTLNFIGADDALTATDAGGGQANITSIPREINNVVGDARVTMVDLVFAEAMVVDTGTDGIAFAAKTRTMIVGGQAFNWSGADATLTANSGGSSFSVNCGDGIGTGDGGVIQLVGGTGGTGSTGAGGNVIFLGGQAGIGSGDGDGGDILFVPGLEDGTGRPGGVVIGTVRGDNVAGELRFIEDGATTPTYGSYVGFKAAPVIAGNVIWTLPIADASGTQALVSDGSLTLSFATVLTNPATANLDMAEFNIDGVVLINGANSVDGVDSENLEIIAGSPAGATTADGGEVIITGGASQDLGAAGDIRISGGLGDRTAGGAVSIFAGAIANGTAATGGVVTIISGAGGATGNSGSVNLSTPTALGGTGVAGAINLTPGTGGSGGGVGGLINLLAGNGAGGGGGGAVDITGGRGTFNGAGNGGIVTIASGAGGTGTGTGAGGALNISSGAGGSASGNSGNVTIASGTTTDGATGSVTLESADATGTNQASGTVTVQAGRATGTGNGGNLVLNAGRGDTAGQVLITGGTGETSGTDGGLVRILGGLQNGVAIGGNVELKASGTSASNAGEVVLEGSAGFELQDIGSVGANTPLDPHGGMVKRLTATAALTLTLGALNNGDIGADMLVLLTDGGGGNVSWSANVEWPGGVAPTLTAAGLDVLRFVTVDAGVSWQGIDVGLDYS